MRAAVCGEARVTWAVGTGEASRGIVGHAHGETTDGLECRAGELCAGSVPVLEATGLSAGYEGTPLVRDVSIRVMPGQVVTLIGPNGAGKSTILKTLAGQLRSLGGSVRLVGTPLDELSEHERALLRSVLLTERSHTELLTCFDVVAMGRYPHTGRLGVLRRADRDAVRDAMELMGVSSLAECDYLRISDGQRQRVLLARAVCQQPRVLLLDEPMSYLDIRFQVELLGTLRHLVATHDLGIVMSLHELSLARQVSDWLVCVKDGAVMAQGTADQVFVPEVIDRLFDLEPGMYDSLTGTIALGALGRGGARAKA